MILLWRMVGAFGYQSKRAIFPAFSHKTMQARHHELSREKS
jgi:hypothetical protein